MRERRNTGGRNLPTVAETGWVRIRRARRAPARSRGPYEQAAIRTLDILLALVAVLVFLPVMLLLCAVIFAHDGGRPIFAHRRIGLGGRRFYCLKFRTMVVDAEARLQAHLAADAAAHAEWLHHQKLTNDPRITPLGAFLRRSSLDELPQLFNVLFGHMGMVGPRPIVDAEIARYGRFFAFYCSVRPGITGLWQVSGRSDTSYRRRVAIDTVYSRRKSLIGDIAIIGRTVPAVLMSRGSC